MGTHPGGKLYKKEIVEKYPFPEGVIYEDLAIAYEHINACEKIAVGKHNLYKYYRRVGSTVNSKFNPKILNFFNAMDCNFGYVDRDFPNNSNMRKAVNSRYVLNGLHVVNAMLKSNMTKDLKNKENFDRTSLRSLSQKIKKTKRKKVRLKNFKFFLFHTSQTLTKTDRI